MNPKPKTQTPNVHRRAVELADGAGITIPANVWSSPLPATVEAYTEPLPTMPGPSAAEPAKKVTAIPRALNPEPWTLDPEPCTLHPAPCTLHPES